ncbi:hypothetical protein VKT23_006884 [Stygiomarasmius scandens]|uniref:Uncharacterized protein n=1 Tax=Marasmiellus scandens TaxID=2682957 RepID=A0ABR1JLY8_9AGAR
MPITELAILKLNPPNTLTTSPIPEHFALLQTRQSAWSSYPLRFYYNIANPSLIYLLSGWDSVDAHGEWIKSDGNQELLKLLGPYLTVEQLAHLDMDSGDMPEGQESQDLLIAKNVGLQGVEGRWVGGGIDLEDASRPFYHLSFCAQVETQEQGVVRVRRIRN